MYNKLIRLFMNHKSKEPNTVHTAHRKLVIFQFYLMSEVLSVALLLVTCQIEVVPLLWCLVPLSTWLSLCCMCIDRMAMFPSLVRLLCGLCFVCFCSRWGTR